jgi:hypothetical protein
MKKSEFKSYLKEEIFEILSEETAQDIEAKTQAQAELNKELEKTKELMKENVSQEVINKVSRFVTSLANYYDYSEQDAVYAIMQALRAHGAGFQVNEEEMDDEEMDKQASSAAQKGDSISKAASKLGEITREMKSVVNQYKKSEEPEKSKHLARLKELTKIKKELEALL